MDFPKNPIAFLDLIITRHKKWLKNRSIQSETLFYMGENVDQEGRGEEFLKHYIFNDNPKIKDPYHPHTDLSLLELYQFWRCTHEMRPIESWDGTKLRPWLPDESNPLVPNILEGDLSEFKEASYRGRKWRSTIDAFGNAIESYFDEVRRYDVWSAPSHYNEENPTKVGAVRFYRHNDLNNIELCPYSIRFWGFLKWTDDQRRKLLGLEVETISHGSNSDITFMDSFNQNHFPWHDDVFNNGKCPDWKGQFGLQQFHKYDRGTQGYALEFLEYHSDLMKVYNDWLEKMNYLPTEYWRESDEPFEPGIHNSGYILKYAFSVHSDENPWGAANSKGKGVVYKKIAPDLFDENLSKFNTIAELGYFLEGLRGVHGIGHVEHCDFRDQYTNNYSLRFFHWHQWIDGLYQKMKILGRPLFNEEHKLETLMGEITDNEKFSPSPKGNLPLNGKWTYRSFHNIPNPDEDSLWFIAEMELKQENDGSITGELRGGSEDYIYEITGFIDNSNIKYNIEPKWYEERSIIVLRARGKTIKTNGHIYEYRGYFSPQWTDGKCQVPAIVGSNIRAIRPDDPSKEGKIGSFIAIKKS